MPALQFQERGPDNQCYSKTVKDIFYLIIEQYCFQKKIKVNWFLNEISESQTQKKNSKGQVVNFYLIENFINEILNLTCES